ncbi:hypothetical protein [Aquincola sp. J276]|uniref:hypothetical protein n=1 Tax=Aquincola sp. J276 TaxID=2898432 RepID=UPI002150F293|nr:hypothetical protein [Aquincola sp. J276]MCR5868157.1 hypothetical protein [Aquincola sp. J276]
MLTLGALLTASLISLQALSVARAFVSAESLWSKSTFTAVLALQQFLEIGLEDDLDRFGDAMMVPFAMRRARAAIEAPDVPLEQAQQYLVDAGVEPADATPMTYLYRLVADMAWAQSTVQRLASADEYVDRLLAVAAQVPRQAERPVDPQDLLRLRADLRRLADHLSTAQHQFGDRLSDLSRQGVRLGIFMTVLLATALAVGASINSLRLQRQDAARGAALEVANERLRLATQSDRLGVFEWPVGTDHIWLDPRCCELYGLPAVPTAVSVERSVLWSRTADQDQPELRDALEQAAARREMFKHRYRICSAPETMRDVEITGLFSAATGRLRMVGVLRDVSEDVRRAQAEADLQAQQAAAQTQARLLSRLSHELRTP